jgi:hypothetical protein
MSAPTVVRDLVVAHTRVLKLPGVARTFEGLARQARDTHWAHEGYLHEVLTAKEASRHESVIRQRLREARFPEVKTLDTFDFAAADGLNATQVHTLARGEWVTAPDNLILAGPIGPATYCYTSLRREVSAVEIRSVMDPRLQPERSRASGSWLDWRWMPTREQRLSRRRTIQRQPFAMAARENEGGDRPMHL